MDNLMPASYSEGLAPQGPEVPQAARVCAPVRTVRGGLFVTNGTFFAKPS